jgi:hypothetical protein
VACCIAGRQLLLAFLIVTLIQSSAAQLAESEQPERVLEVPAGGAIRTISSCQTREVVSIHVCPEVVLILVVIITSEWERRARNVSLEMAAGRKRGKGGSSVGPWGRWGGL